MSMTDQMSTADRTITAFFDRREAAETASRDLVNAGVARDRIAIVAGASSEAAARPAARPDKGFWESLKDLFLPEEDRSVYAEGLQRGGYLLTVRTTAASYAEVLDILDREGTVDMGEREATWRSQGWQGYQAGAYDRFDQDRAVPAAADLPMTSAAGTTAARQDAATTAGAAAATHSEPVTGASAQRLEAGRDDVLPVVEEQIALGKRDVSHGKVRLRSYVVETPVNESVQLRNESIEVERRPVDRAVGPGDATFQDRVIEAEEFAEEAVVSKTARVTEEVALRKVADARTETISDTVRRTEVDVDDARKHWLAGAKSASMIVPDMDVIASDGEKIGTVDHLEGQDRIKLARNASPDGQHHFIPVNWVEHVDQHVHLNKPRQQVLSGW